MRDILSMAQAARANAGQSFTNIRMIDQRSNAVAPELNYVGLYGSWFNGIDVANNGGAKDFVVLGQRDPYDGSAGDLIYVAHNGLVHANVVGAVSASTSVVLDSVTDIVTGMVVGGTGIAGYPTVSSINAGTKTVTLSAPQTLTDGRNLKFYNAPTLGFGVTPPAKGTFRSQFASFDGEPAMGTIGVRVGSSQTGDAIQIYDSSGVAKWWIDKAFYQSPTALRDTSTPAANLLSFNTNNLATQYAWAFAGGSSIRFRYATGAVNLLQFDTDGTSYVYNRLILVAGQVRHGSTTGVAWLSGSGSPEGSKTAPVGSLYSRTDGGAGTSFYVKESGTGNTGWVAK